jgi:lysozyme
MSIVRQRWASKLIARREMLADARKSVAYWAKRAGNARGRGMLEEAKTRRALRQRQVTEAERVLDRHPGQVTTLSPAGVALVASFEGFRAAPYRDAVGVATIGYGETRGITMSTRPWTREHAAAQLRVRLNRDYLRPVLAATRAAGLTLTQNQADALASLAYNLGPGIFARGRTMGDAIASRDHRRIADAFLEYASAGGRVLPGLARRRRAERALYLRTPPRRST